MKAKRFLFLIMAICLASGVKAQIYNSEVLFYVHEDSKLSDPQTSLRIFRFQNGQCQWVADYKLKDVSDNLKNNINYYETHSNIWKRYGDIDTYDSNMSNTKWNVYLKHFEVLYYDNAGTVEWPAHNKYHAFAKDFSKFMVWSEPEFDTPYGVHMGSRYTFKRLTKSELLKLSFTGARDFLQ